MVSSVSGFSPLQEYYNKLNADFNEQFAYLDTDGASGTSNDATGQPDMSHVPLPKDLASFAQAMDNFVEQSAYSYEAKSFILTAQSFVDTETIINNALARQSTQQDGYAEFQELIAMDPDQDFQVSYENFKQIMTYLGGGETSASEEQDQEMFSGLDKNGDGNISLVDYFA